MNCNVEIKARLRDRRRVERELEILGAGDAGIETQRDTFWRTPRGRLKLRESSRDGATLIAYAREDAAELRPSSYVLVPVSDPDRYRAVLDQVLERGGEVLKTRHLYFVDNVRVHLDDVTGLGAFLELEAVVDAAHPAAECASMAERLLTRFEIAAVDRVAVAYVDLLGAAEARPR